MAKEKVLKIPFGLETWRKIRKKIEGKENIKSALIDAIFDLIYNYLKRQGYSRTSIQRIFFEEALDRYIEFFVVPALVETLKQGKVPKFLYIDLSYKWEKEEGNMRQERLNRLVERFGIKDTKEKDPKNERNVPDIERVSNLGGDLWVVSFAPDNPVKNIIGGDVYKVKASSKEDAIRKATQKYRSKSYTTKLVRRGRRSENVKRYIKPTKRVNEDRVDDVIRELGSWFPSFAEKTQEFFLRFLASLPGGDELEDMGYEPFILGWKEVSILGKMIQAIRNQEDVKRIVDFLIGEYED